MSPLLCMGCAYVLGVGLASAVAVPLWLVLLVALPGAPAALLLRARDRTPEAIACLLLCACGTGALGHIVSSTPGRSDPVHLPQGAEVALLGALVSDLREGPFASTTVLKVVEARLGDRRTRVRGAVLVEAQRPPKVGAGDEVVVVGRMAALREASRPGGFDAKRYYARRYGAFSRIRGAAIVPTGRASPLGYLQRARTGTIERVRQLSPGGGDDVPTDVMLSMVFGSSSLQIPEDVMESFRRAGTVHVLVVSGAQLGLLAGIALWLTGRLRAGPWVEAGVATALAGAYALMLPADGTILRALGLVSLLVVGRALNRDPDVVAALVSAVFLTILLWPGRVFDVSLQLSATALLGVVYGVRTLGPLPAVGRLPWHARLRRSVWQLAAASLGATLATTPILLGTWGQASLVAPVANLLAVPLASLLCFLMFLSAPLGYLIPPLAKLLNVAAHHVAQGLIRSTEWIATAPGAAIEVTPVPGWATILLYAVLTVATVRAVRARRRKERASLRT